MVGRYGYQTRIVQLPVERVTDGADGIAADLRHEGLGSVLRDMMAPARQNSAHSRLLGNLPRRHSADNPQAQRAAEDPAARPFGPAKRLRAGSACAARHRPRM